MEIINKILELKKLNRPFVVATIVDVLGSTPGKVGFKMIITDDATHGTVGGGAIEVEVINKSREIIKSGNNQIQEYILTDKNIELSDKFKIVPMSCDGRISIFYEVYNNYPNVYIFGGGHVGNALLQFLSHLPYHTVLIDNRQEFANKEKNSLASEIVFNDYLEYVNQFNPINNSYIVILTHQHIYDYDILKTIYQRTLNIKYVGVIASKNKADKMISKLKLELGENINLKNLHTPIGLMIGGNTASEIALSIAAEIQKENYDK